MEKKNEPENTSWEIYTSTAPFIEISNGNQRLLRLYGMTSTQKANAELICKSVNNHDKLVKALKLARKLILKNGVNYDNADIYNAINEVLDLE